MRHVSGMKITRVIITLRCCRWRIRDWACRRQCTQRSKLNWNSTLQMSSHAMISLWVAIAQPMYLAVSFILKILRVHHPTAQI